MLLTSCWGGSRTKPIWYYIFCCSRWANKHLSTCVSCRNVCFLSFPATRHSSPPLLLHPLPLLLTQSLSSLPSWSPLLSDLSLYLKLQHDLLHFQSPSCAPWHCMMLNVAWKAHPQYLINPRNQLIISLFLCIIALCDQTFNIVAIAVVPGVTINAAWLPYFDKKHKSFPCYSKRPHDMHF